MQASVNVRPTMDPVVKTRYRSVLGQIPVGTAYRSNRTILLCFCTTGVCSSGEDGGCFVERDIADEKVYNGTSACIKERGSPGVCPRAPNYFVLLNRAVSRSVFHHLSLPPFTFPAPSPLFFAPRPPPFDEHSWLSKRNPVKKALAGPTLLSVIIM